MGWFKDRSETVVAALTVRRIIALPALIGAVTGIIKLVPLLASAAEEPVLLGVPAIAWGVGAGLLLLLYFVIEYATRLRKQIKGTRVGLSRLRSEGVEKRNRGRENFATKDDFEKWRAEVLDWNQRVIKEIRNITEADAEWFSVLDVVYAPRLSMNTTPPAPAWHEDHKKHYGEHDERLKRLGEMIQNLWRDE
jgi:hypothetical protein